MPKRGDIIVRTGSDFAGSAAVKAGVNKIGSMFYATEDNPTNAYYAKTGSISPSDFRFATIEEGNYYLNKGIRNVKDIKKYPTKYSKNYWQNSKFGQLTPESSRHIQVYLFSLGFKWNTGQCEIIHTKKKGIITYEKSLSYISTMDYFLESNHIDRTQEILDLIYNKNTKNEVPRKSKENTRREINGSAAISKRCQQITVGIRYIGNKTIASVKKSIIREQPINRNPIFCKNN
jgi:hypothetical protein